MDLRQLLSIVRQYAQLTDRTRKDYAEMVRTVTQLYIDKNAPVDEPERSDFIRSAEVMINREYPWFPPYEVLLG